MLVTVFGIYIDFKLTQSLNAYLAIVSIFDPDANSRVSIVELFSNALFPIILISFDFFCRRTCNYYNHLLRYSTMQS